MSIEKTYLGFIRISGGSSWYQTNQKEYFELIAYKTVKHIYNKMYGLYADVSKHIQHYIGNACNRMY